jgi:hypothetical protein
VFSTGVKHELDTDGVEHRWRRMAPGLQHRCGVEHNLDTTDTGVPTFRDVVTACNFLLPLPVLPACHSTQQRDTAFVIQCGSL